VVRRWPRRHHVLQHRPACFGQRQCRGAGLFPVRSSLSRRRGSPAAAAGRAQGAALDVARERRALPALQRPCDRAGHGVLREAGAMHVEGIVSKRTDAPYTPGNRGLWRKVKCLNRAEFVVVGWSEPEGRRPYLGSLLLGYYGPDGRLIY